MAKRIRMVCTAAAAVPLALLAACGSSGSSSPASSLSPSATSSAAASTGVALTETGSTLMFPLFGAWQTAYNTTVKDVTITTAGTGSGTGIADATSGTVTMGGSDAYLSSAEMTQDPGLLNIPLAVSGGLITYNLPGVKAHVKFNGTVLAKIYSGKITKWNDPAIAQLNPGVTLPSMTIVPLHRSDSSGTTFIYVSYLNAQDPADWPSADVGTTVNWPSVAGAAGQLGNGGMVSGCSSTKGCIAYVGTSYLAKTAAAGLGEGELANGSGQFELPTTASEQTALATFAPKTPANETQPLINAATGYPVINYEYVIVKKTQPSAAVASALKAFLNWTLTTGSSATYLGPVSFEALPASVKALSQTQINSISG